MSHGKEKEARRGWCACRWADKTERYSRGTKLYRVVWKDWATDTATWEPAKNISPDLLSN